MHIHRETLLEMYRRMVRIREFELAAIDLFKRGQVKGTVHPYIGQEAAGVGVCMALRRDDLIAGTHRSHGHNIAKGADVKLMMAELLGKETGYCKGRGGSMHIAAFETGSLGALAVVGAGLPIAVGAALAFKMKGQDGVAVPFTGDAGSNTGNFHEGLNMASVWKLPVVFVVENNQFGVSTRISETTNISDLSVRAAGYGIPGIAVDGLDVLAVYDEAVAAVERARRGEGPTLLVAESYRVEGHYAGEPEVYRTREEVEEHRKNDPITRFADFLVSSGRASAGELEAIAAETRKETADAVQFARQSPTRSFHRDGLHLRLSGGDGDGDSSTRRGISGALAAPMPSDLIVQVPAGVPAKDLSYQEAIREGLREEMLRDERVFLIGEDIGKHGGAFGVTRTLYDQFGPERVRNTPISENTIVGAATGAAIVGMRPVAEIMFVDFSGLAMDQIATEAAKLHFMTAGQLRVPWVLRMPQGGGAGKSIAAQHPQSLEMWFANIPGLKVVHPSTPYDAKGLLKASIRDDNPVIFLEHKFLYSFRGLVPDADYEIPLGRCDVKREGTDVTVVANGYMVWHGMMAARILADEGISVEVIDVQTISPLDEETIGKSVRKTGRAVVVAEAPRTYGPTGEWAMVAMEQAFDYLQAPIVRVAGRNSPVPFANSIEAGQWPTTEDVVKAIRSTVV